MLIHLVFFKISAAKNRPFSTPDLRQKSQQNQRQNSPVSGVA
jgi:hypothetical protein